MKDSGRGTKFHSTTLQWAPAPQAAAAAAAAAAARGGAEPPSRTQEKIDLIKSRKAFWDFVETLRSGGNKGGLASVGDVYPQVRLHPNSELAALLAWKVMFQV